jgi:hypothetical protein
LRAVVTSGSVSKSSIKVKAIHHRKRARQRSTS